MGKKYDYISRTKLMRKQTYCFRTEDGAFPKSEWFFKWDDVNYAKSEDVIPMKWVEKYIGCVDARQQRILKKMIEEWRKISK